MFDHNIMATCKYMYMSECLLVPCMLSGLILWHDQTTSIIIVAIDASKS